MAACGEAGRHALGLLHRWGTGGGGVGTGKEEESARGSGGIYGWPSDGGVENNGFRKAPTLRDIVSCWHNHLQYNNFSSKIGILLKEVFKGQNVLENSFDQVKMVNTKCHLSEEKNSRCSGKTPVRVEQRREKARRRVVTVNRRPECHICSARRSLPLIKAHIED